MARLLALVAALALGLPAQAQVAPGDGLPAVRVQDLHYGDVLYYFYQDDYFDALVRLAAYHDQGRLKPHERDAELLRGGLWLSLGQHREAREIFERLLGDPATPPGVRDQAWFYLGKVLYASGRFDESEAALRAAGGSLPAALSPERRLLLAQGLMYRGRYDAAIAELENWQGPASWTAYGQFNLGVALVRAGRIEPGLQLLERVGTLDAQNGELVALRDKANLASGYALLQAGRPVQSRVPLARVRLAGPHAGKALLGAGWADAAEGRYDEALVPWAALHGRNLLDAAVQESYLAVPYAYAELGALAQATDYYERAIAAYEAERARIAESIAAIREGRLLAAAVAADRERERGWFGQLEDLPDAPESRYLYQLLAGHDFQEGLKSYRALEAMARNLSAWSESLGAFGDMVATRDQAFARRLPAAETRLATVDLAGINTGRDRLRARLDSALAVRDTAALATAREQDWLATLDGVDAELARHAGDPAYDDAREKARLARGVVIWRLDEAWKVRSWQANRSMRALDAAVYDARTRSTGSSRAREGAPERTAALGHQVVAMTPRVAGLAVRVASAKSAQAKFLADIAVAELEAQARRLDEYSVQARYAIATIYDRANAQGEGP